MKDIFELPVLDHHCHVYTNDFQNCDPALMGRLFYHGFGDIYTPDAKKEKQWGKSAELQGHYPHMAVIKALVCQLSKTLKCEATLEAVCEKRNQLTRDSFKGYINLLHQDAHIVSTVIDSECVANDPILDLFPHQVLRLFSLDPALSSIISKVNDYDELIGSLVSSLKTHIKEHNYIGVKAHIAEQNTFACQPVWYHDAKTAFNNWKGGDESSFSQLYTGVFTEILLQCQELNVPVHLHSGCSGSIWKGGHLNDSDPFLFGDFLRKKEFIQSKIVFLHSGYPFCRQAGQMAHCFPNVYVDMSVAAPWGVFNLKSVYEDVMSWAPLSKIMFGSGGHGSPEVSYLAAKLSKIALADTLAGSVGKGLLQQNDVVEIAKMILYDNAARLYCL